MDADRIELLEKYYSEYIRDDEQAHTLWKVEYAKKIADMVPEILECLRPNDGGGG